MAPAPRESASRPPLQQTEVGLVSGPVTVVIVDDRLEDTAGQLGQLRRGRWVGGRPAPAAAAGDRQPVVPDRARDGDRAGGPTAAEEEVAQLVHRDAQVLDL